MNCDHRNSFNALSQLSVGQRTYDYYRLSALGEEVNRLPITLKIVLENLLRHEDDKVVRQKDILAILNWLKTRSSEEEIAYSPARVLMQDFTGVPAVVDLAAMRDAVQKLGGDVRRINPLTPVDLVIDHSVQVDHFGLPNALKQNTLLDMHRNYERYEFLRWGQDAFANFRVVPPGTGICHQVNLEYLAQVVWTKEQAGRMMAYPDTLVGTDSHTTMINGLAVLGWGVGGIEAEAAMLGQPISMVIPEVIGVKLIGSLREGVTATDLVLTVTEILRQKGVVNKFVEFFGSGVSTLPLADRATIANMAPEYGATCGYFPVDEETIRYLMLTSRDPERIALVEAYAKAQGLWHDPESQMAEYTNQLTLDLSLVEPSVAGPKRPQDRVVLSKVPASFQEALPLLTEKHDDTEHAVEGKEFSLKNGDIVIAAITSCTNTSNPGVMVAAGLLAQKAAEKGLHSKSWVKTSLSPGSKIVTEYYAAGGLDKALDAQGFHVVGYGCMTCIGNSGPLPQSIENTISEHDLAVVSVLSGNRNFEGRVHPHVKANYLASPPLVVAYALVGNIHHDWQRDPIGMDQKGNPVYLKDLWPTQKEINNYIARVMTPKMFKEKYSDVFSGDVEWQALQADKSLTYHWKPSTYINNPPYFKGMGLASGKGSDIHGARVLAMLGDSITTDHISPAGNIAKHSPAAQYLRSQGVEPADFNSYGARRGNDEVMVRGTFANIRLKNELLPGKEGGVTNYLPTNEEMSIYDAAMRYKENHIPLVVIAGKEYGTGSSRDWAAKGTLLLGVKAVIAESFERIHRSNLVGMGVLPLVFKSGVSRKTLGLDGTEIIDIEGLSTGLRPRMDVTCVITRADATKEKISLLCRIDTENELEYFQHGGILHYVIRQLLANANAAEVA